MKYHFIENRIFFKTLILFILTFSSVNIFAQNQNSYLKDTTALFSEKYELLQEKGELEYELLEMKNTANEQRTYKLLFLTLSGFILLFSIMIVVIFYTKSKKITDLANIQTEEILLRDIKADQLSLVLNTVNTPILISLASGKIKWINNAFSQMYNNIDLNYLEENNSSNFFNDIIDEKEKQMIFDAFEKKTNISYNISGKNKEENIERKITLLLDSSNNITGFAVTDNILNKI